MVWLMEDNDLVYREDGKGSSDLQDAVRLEVVFVEKKLTWPAR